MSDQQPPSYGNPPAGPPAGWYPDPNGLQVLRWWDGRQWGPQTQPMPGAGPAAGPSHAPFPPAQPQPPDPLQPQGSPQQPYGQEPQGPQPPYPGPQHGPVPPGRGRRKPWPARRKAGVAAGAGTGILVLLLIIIGVSGGSGGSGSGAGGAPSAAAGSPSAAAGSPSAAAAGSPSSAPCTTHSCIVQDARSLVGAVAKDDSVMTKMHCYSTSVQNPDAGIYTVSCVATYSDGSVWDGIATVLLSKSQVTWEPTQEVS